MSIPTEYTPELEYDASKLVHSNPKFTTIQAQNTQAFSFGATHTSGSGLFELVIPSAVVNLSRSRLQFSITTTVTTEANIIALCPSQLISRVSLSTVSGTLLCDIPAFNKYFHMVGGMSTSQSDLNTYPQGPGSTGFVYDGTTATRGLPRTLGDAKLWPRGALTRSDAPHIPAATAGITNVVGDVARSPVQHINCKYWEHDIAAATNVLYWDVSLGELMKHTLMSVDKLMYFGESLSLQIYYDAPQNYITSAVLPSTTYFTAGTGVYSAGAITAPTLVLMQEQNMDLANYVANKFMRDGVDIPFSYVYGSRSAVAASQNQTVQQTINSSLGSSLLFVAAAPFQSTDQRLAFLSNDIVPVTRNNVTGTALTNYNTFIDSIPVSSPSNHDSTISQEYRANQANFEGSAFPLSLQEFKLYFTHVDNFTGLPLWQLDKSQTQINGMSLGASRIWSIQANWAASVAKNWHIFWAVQRVLKIKDGRCSVV